MYKFSWTSGFRRRFKKTSRGDKHLQDKIFNVLEELSEDPFTPSLKTHKLHGKLAGLWACQVQYDCRVVFTFEKMPESDEIVIVLIDIGKHDEVY
jgi:addiction module RelE/StbE family toxin